MNQADSTLELINIPADLRTELPSFTSQLKFNHPKQLFTISFYTMWVTFSFYGMKALLIAYMVTQMHLAQANGYAVLGTYSALVFGLPFIGGMIADRILGNRKSIIWGSILMIAGHLTLAIPYHQTFFAGLALVACGCGFGSGTDNALVGSLYSNKDTRRKDAGFSIFYMLFNLGGALGGLICGYVGQTINWHYGFGLAGLFMICGLINFIFGINKIYGTPPDNNKLKEKVFLNISYEWSIYIGSLIAIAFVTLLFYHTHIMDFVMLPLTLISFLYILYISFRFSKQERRKLFAALTLLLFTSFFWAFYEQSGGSMNLFVLQNVNLNVGNMHFSGLSINNFLPSFFLFALTPLALKTWNGLHKINKEPRSELKFVIAFLFLGSYFLTLWIGCYLYRASGMVPIAFLFIGYLLMEFAELNLGPVSFSLSSKLSPLSIASTMMGVMYLSVSLGEYFSGKLGAAMAVPAGIINPVKSLTYYNSIFLRIAACCLIIAVILLSLNRLIKKCMQEIR